MYNPIETISFETALEAHKTLLNLEYPPDQQQAMQQLDIIVSYLTKNPNSIVAIQFLYNLKQIFESNQTVYTLPLTKSSSLIYDPNAPAPSIELIYKDSLPTEPDIEMFTMMSLLNNASVPSSMLNTEL